MNRSAACAAGVMLVVVAMACGDFGSDDPAPQNDAGAHEASAETSLPSDASTPCAPRGDFVRVEPLRSLSDAVSVDGHESLTPDELHIYFQRTTAGSPDSTIMTASRASPDVEFGPPTELFELHAYSQTTYVATPSISPDGAHLALAVYMKTDQTHRYDLAIVDRLTGSSAFGPTPVPATAVNDPTSSQHSPAYQGDGSRLFFSSDKHHVVDAGGNAETIFVSANGPGSDVIDAVTKEPLVGYGPVPSFDAKTLYFARIDEVGRVHLYLGDLSADARTVTNVARIMGPTGPYFGSETSDESIGWVSPDNCRMYIGIDADGQSHLWVASRR